MFREVAEQVRMDFADGAVGVYLDARWRRLPLNGRHAAEQQTNSEDEVE
jgi:hypothetical protein